MMDLSIITPENERRHPILYDIADCKPEIEELKEFVIEQWNCEAFKGLSSI